MHKSLYGDLSYFTSNETFDYSVSKINLSDFVKDRIEYFNIIAKTQERAILNNIEDNISIFMNKTELERLINNNLLNVIKHSLKLFDIYGSL